MGWSAEHVVHPLETGPKMHWDLVQPLLSVCLPVSSHLWPPFFPSWKEVYLAGKETPLTVVLKIPESERRGNFNSWGLSPLSLKIFSFPKNLGSSAFCSLDQRFQTFPLSRPSFVAYISFAPSMDSYNLEDFVCQPAK